MNRSSGSDHPTHRGVRPTVGALVAVLALAACGAPSAEPSASPFHPASIGASPTPSTPAAPSGSGGPTPGVPTTGSRATFTTPASPTPAMTSAGPTPLTTAHPVSPTSAPSTTTPRPTPTRTASATADLVDLWAGQDIEAFDTTRRVVALTFDGGASADAVRPILATLRSAGVPATFFVTGEFARRYPDEVRAIAAAGHPVGNHSDTHPYFTRITDERIRAELSAADGSISALTGRSTGPLFRFPFGDRTSYDIGVVNDAGYVPIRWTVDTLGWKGTSGGSSTAVVQGRVLDALRPGEIVLMHVGANPDDGSTLDADALPGLIRALRERGYGFATLPELLGERA